MTIGFLPLVTREHIIRINQRVSNFVRRNMPTVSGLMNTKVDEEIKNPRYE